jgi:ATP-dependent helicase HrpB
MPAFDFSLPIDAALPELTAALRAGTRAVLVAPPGAGKTTRVPLALMDADWARGRRIIVLEPRRLAARAAAERMAATLGEEVGATIGLRMRMVSKTSKATRVEVVTEGVFARMILDDPELSGVAAVLFDEYHERSLDADHGAGVGARRAGRPARRSAPAGHVGDARRGAGGAAARRRAGHRIARPRLSGRDDPCRPRSASRIEEATVAGRA